MSEQWGDPDPDRTWRPEVEQRQPDYDYVAAALPHPWTPAPKPPLLARAKADALTGFGTAAVVVLLGAPLAYLWRAVAPTAVVLRTASGPQPAAPESSQVFATDGWFALVSLLAGAFVGVVAWVVLRRRGPAAPLGLGLGGLTASVVAAVVGRRIVVDRYLYDFCHGPDIRCWVYDGTMHLHAGAAVVVFPTAALVAFVALTLAISED